MSELSYWHKQTSPWCSHWDAPVNHLGERTWTHTFLRGRVVLRPQPHPSVFITSVSAYSRLEKHWFSQLSPAGHTWQQQQHEGYVRRCNITPNKQEEICTHTHTPVDDTRTAACGWDTGSRSCMDAHRLVCSCIVGFLISQLHGPAPSPLVCWTGMRKHSSRISKHSSLTECKVTGQGMVKWQYLDEFVGRRFTRVAFLFQSLPALPLCL